MMYATHPKDGLKNLASNCGYKTYYHPGSTTKVIFSLFDRQQTILDWHVPVFSTSFYLRSEKTSGVSWDRTQVVLLCKQLL